MQYESIVSPLVSSPTRCRSAHLQCVGALLLELCVELLAPLVQCALQSVELRVQRLLVLPTVLLRAHTTQRIILYI